MAQEVLQIPEKGCKYRRQCQFYDIAEKVNFGSDSWRHTSVLLPKVRAEMCDAVKPDVRSGAYMPGCEYVPLIPNVVHGSMDAEDLEVCHVYSMLEKIAALSQKISGELVQLSDREYK